MQWEPNKKKNSEDFLYHSQSTQNLMKIYIPPYVDCFAWFSPRLGVKKLTWEKILLGVKKLTWEIILLGVKKLTWEIILLGVKKLTWEIILLGVKKLTWEIILLNLCEKLMNEWISELLLFNTKWAIF